MRILYLVCLFGVTLSFQSTVVKHISVVRSVATSSDNEIKPLAIVQPWLLWTAVASTVIVGDDLSRSVAVAAVAARCIAAVLDSDDIVQSIALGRRISKRTEENTIIGGPLTTTAGDGMNHLLMTIELDIKPGRSGIVQKLLKQYFDDVATDSKTQKIYLSDDSTDFPKRAVCAAQLAPDAFVITTRFRTATNTDKAAYVAAHHASIPFVRLTESLRPFLAEPARLYLVDESDGRLGNARYPFGPGGEGGRDDSIYSSPANLDGSQTGSKLGVEAARDVDLRSLSN